MNNVSLIGRLTRDPELRYTPNGVATCSFTLAVDNPFKKEDPKADFIPIVVWQKAAESSAQYLAKGKQCAVEGRMQTRNYDNAEGRKIYITEVVAQRVQFLEQKSNQQQSNQSDPFQGQGQPIDISDDDLPFK